MCPYQDSNMYNACYLTVLMIGDG